MTRGTGTGTGRPVGACPTCDDAAFLLAYLDPSRVAARLGWSLVALSVHLRRHGAAVAPAFDTARERSR